VNGTVYKSNRIKSLSDGITVGRLELLIARFIKYTYKNIKVQKLDNTHTVHTWIIFK